MGFLSIASTLLLLTQPLALSLPTGGTSLDGLRLSIHRTVPASRLSFCVQLAVATKSSSKRGGRTLGCLGARRSAAGNAAPVRWLMTDERDGEAKDKGIGKDDAVIGVARIDVFVEQWQRNFSEWGRGRRLGGIVIVMEDKKPMSTNITAELVSCSNGKATPTVGESEGDGKCVDGFAGLAARFPVPFPIVMLEASQLEAAVGLSLRQLRRQRPRLWAELQFTYSDIRDPRRCRRRQARMYSTALGRYATSVLNPETSLLCRPLTDDSLIWTVAELPAGQTRSNASVLLVLVRLDAFSIFSGGFGAGWQTEAGRRLRSSLAVALALAGGLADWNKSIASSARNSAWSGRDVVLLFLSGEDYGHMASRAVARRLLGQRDTKDGSRLLGGRSQPARILAEHVHSVVEIGRLGGTRRPRFISAGSGANLRRLQSHRLAVAAGIDNATVGFPAWSSLSVLSSLPGGGLPGLLLTTTASEEAENRRHYDDSSEGNGTDSSMETPLEGEDDDKEDREESLDSLLVSVTDQLIGLAVNFLTGSSTSTSKSLASTRQRVKEASACLNLDRQRGNGSQDTGELGCSILETVRLIDARGLSLARGLHRWRSGAGLGAGFASSGSVLACRKSGSGGQIQLANGSQQCGFSSLASFHHASDTLENGNEKTKKSDNFVVPEAAEFAASAQDTDPSLRLFVAASRRAEFLALGLGAGLALLSVHFTAAASLYFMQLSSSVAAGDAETS